jgi:RimJ/RimL family protein N-acetyltransferase
MALDIEISTDPARLDLAMVHEYLSQTSYWARGRPRETVERSLANSLCFGAYAGGRQIGFARVATDRAVFAYLMDVFVLPEHQGGGVATRLMEQVLAHPDLQGLRLFALRTRDAHDLYARFGFTLMADPESMMVIQAHDAQIAGASPGVRINELGQPIGPALAAWSVPHRPPRESMNGRFCRVVPLEERFAADLYGADAADRDGRTWTYLPYGPFATLEAYMSWMRGHWLGPDPFFYAIVERHSNRAVGVAAHMRIQPEAGSLEVGHVHFSPALQRTPAATEAMFLMAQRAFALGYRRYEWKCDALNAASRAAAQRFGFSFEGIFRQATVVKGRNRDTAWYAMVDRDWPAIAAVFQRWLAPANFDEHGRQRESLSGLMRGRKRLRS